MAHAPTFTDVYPKAGVFARVVDWLKATMEEIADSNPRLRRVRWLQDRSDAELAALNIKRDQIVHHVFRDVYYT